MTRITKPTPTIGGAGTILYTLEIAIDVERWDVELGRPDIEAALDEACINDIIKDALHGQFDNDEIMDAEIDYIELLDGDTFTPDDEEE